MVSQFKLSKEQQNVIFGNEKLKRVIACAGSGKTSVLTQSIVNLLNNKLCQPSQILALTFTKNAAENMKRRVEEELNYEINLEFLDIYTFNSFGNKIIRENSYQLGLSKNFDLLNEAQSWQIIFEIFKYSNFVYLKAKKDIAKFTKKILEYIWNIKNNLLEQKEIEDYIINYQSYLSAYKSKSLLNEEIKKINFLKEIFEIYKDYERIKLQNNFIDYADQIYLPYLLFKNTKTLKEKYTQKYKYIFVDEFQDTNNSQARFLSQIFNPKENNIIIVGDDDQGIYSFRGATIENIQDLKYLSPNFDQNLGAFKNYFLTINFRSGKEIIDFSNNIIRKNKNREDKIMQPESHEKISEIFFFKSKDLKNEADYISHMILLLKERGVLLKNIAILCRRKRFNEIIKSLKEKNISYEFVGNKNFFYESEILFIISWLKFINDIYDDESILYILKSSKYKISDRDIFFLRNYNYIRDKNYLDIENFQSGQYSGVVSNGDDMLTNKVVSNDVSFKMNKFLIDGLRNAPKNVYLSNEAKLRISSLLADLDFYIKNSEKLNLRGIIELIFHYSGLYLELSSKFGEKYKRKIRNIEGLMQIASEFESNNFNVNFENFVIYLKELAKAEFEDPESQIISKENSVKLMSIHAAKGLEFDVVFLPMLWENDYKPTVSSKVEFELPAALRNDGKIWSKKPYFKSAKKFKTEIKNILEEEERRIFYVALTRAKKFLILSYPRTENLPNNEKNRPKDILRFLEDGFNENFKDYFGYLEGYNDIKSYIKDEDGFNKESILNNFLAKINKLNFHKNYSERNIQDILVNNMADNTTKIKGIIKERLKLIDVHLYLELEKKLAKDILEFNTRNYVTILQQEQVHKSKKDNGKALAESDKFFTLTEILTYLSCPKLYEYKYVLNLPEKNIDKVNFGIKVHKLIELITKNYFEIFKRINSKKGLNSLEIKSLKMKILDDVGNINDNKLRNCIFNYIMSDIFDFENVREVFFEKLFYLKIDDFFIRCQIDRIDLCNDGKIKLYDFKTGGLYPLEINKSYYSNQIFCYMVAVSDFYSIDLKNVFGFIFFLVNGLNYSLVLNNEKVNEFKNKMLKAIKGINSSKFRKSKNQDCKKCNFKVLCS